jgi:glutamate--cysteine ligase
VLPGELALPVRAVAGTPGSNVTLKSLRVAFREFVAQYAFATDRGWSGLERIGAEVEFLPIDTASGTIAPIDAQSGPATGPVLRGAAREYEWREVRSSKSGAPLFILPNGGRISYEPGGQIEYAAPPFHSVSALLDDIEAVIGQLSAALERAGIVPLHLGIDPTSPVERVPLRVESERYRHMDAYFATLGQNGARMMRQTASLQLTLERGPDPLLRWQLLNALVPYLAAVFANSPVYAGRSVGSYSMRRLVWDSLDPARTGIPWDAQAVDRYAAFALAAPVFVEGLAPSPFPPLGELLERWGELRPESCVAHLSTLFPEVRPRGYYEVRTVDALDPHWYAAPLLFLVGLVWNPKIAAAAIEISGDPDPTLLRLASRRGLEDERLGPRSQELFRLALSGCESLPVEVLRRRDLERAMQFFEQYTRAGRCPGAEWPYSRGALERGPTANSAPMYQQAQSQ